MCSICLFDQDLIYLNATNEETSKLLTMLENIVNIPSIDNYFSKICTSCILKLESSYAFKQQCMKSYKRLISSQSDIKNQTKDKADVSIVLSETSDEIILEAINELTKQNLICGMCSYKGTSKKSLSLHIFHSHRLQKENWCSLCNIFIENLREHNKSHENHLCQFCDKKLHKSKYIDHLKSHLNIKLYECRKCIEKFESNTDLQRHLTSGHRDSKTVCDVCQKNFTTKESLKKHEKLHDSDNIYKCQCGKVCRSPSELSEHERVHTGERPFMCNVCGKNFKTSASLRAHMILHTGKNETCDICDKKFAQKSELKLHLRKHAGYRPFLCTKCGCGFYQKSHLSDHMKKHEEQAIFSCEVCGKVFRRVETLRRHSSTHLFG